MKKILILTFIICIFLNNISYCEDYDTQPLTLQNFNFEFNYTTPNLDLTLQNFNFEFEYIKATFIFNLSEIKSDYFRYKKLTELYPQLTGIKSIPLFWRELATLENDVYYRQPNLEYLKFRRLSEKYK